MDKFLKNKDFSDLYGENVSEVDIMLPADINDRLNVYHKYVEFVNTRMSCVEHYTTVLDTMVSSAGIPSKFIFPKSESAMLFKLGTADIQAC